MLCYWLTFAMVVWLTWLFECLWHWFFGYYNFFNHVMKVCCKRKLPFISTCYESFNYVQNVIECWTKTLTNAKEKWAQKNRPSCAKTWDKQRKHTSSVDHLFCNGGLQNNAILSYRYLIVKPFKVPWSFVLSPGHMAKNKEVELTTMWFLIQIRFCKLLTQYLGSTSKR